MYTTKSLTISFVIGLIAGLIATWTLFYFKTLQATTQRSQALVSTLSNLPLCKNDILTSAQLSDTGLLTDRLAYDMVTLPRLNDALAHITGLDGKNIFKEEIARETAELALYKQVYQDTHHSEYVPTKEEAAAIKDNYAYGVGTSDSAYLGILRGNLEHAQREYYIFALASTNTKVEQNAEAFMVYKENLVAKIEKVK